MDQSFRLLRSQYNELQKSHEESLEGKDGSDDLVKKAAPKGMDSMKELKADLGTRLDQTIAALEKLAG